MSFVLYLAGLHFSHCFALPIQNINHAHWKIKFGLRVCFSVIPSFYMGRVGNQLRHPRTPCVPIRCWRLWQNVPKRPLLGPWHPSNEHQLEISQCGDLLSFYTAGIHSFHFDETELCFFKHSYLYRDMKKASIMSCFHKVNLSRIAEHLCGWISKQCFLIT